MDFYQQSHVDKKSDYSRMTSRYISIISDQIWKFKFYIFERIISTRSQEEI